MKKEDWEIISSIKVYKGFLGGTAREIWGIFISFFREGLNFTYDPQIMSIIGIGHLSDRRDSSTWSIKKTLEDIPNFYGFCMDLQRKYDCEIINSFPIIEARRLFQEILLVKPLIIDGDL